MGFTTNFGLHSQTTRLQGRSKRRATLAGRGLTPALGEAPFRGTRASVRRRKDRPKHHISRRPTAGGFGAGLFPLHSPLLGESLLVSFPPLNNMLKFSG